VGVTPDYMARSSGTNSRAVGRTLNRRHRPLLHAIPLPADQAAAPPFETTRLLTGSKKWLSHARVPPSRRCGN